MKKVMIGLMFLMAAGSLFALKPVNVNLFSNPDFENTTLSPWVKTGPAGSTSQILIDTDAASGLQSVRCAVAASNIGGVGQNVAGWLAEDGGCKIRVSFWYKLKSGSNRQFKTIVYEYWAGSGGAQVNTVTMVTPTSQWQYFSREYTIRTNTVYTNQVNLTIRYESGAACELLIDDAALYKMAGPVAALTSPAMGATDVSINTSLQWTPADVSAYQSPSDPNAFAVRTNQYLYLQANSSNFTDVAPIVLGADDTSYTPPAPLNLSTKYYWAIDTGIDGSDPRRSSDPNSNDPNTLLMPYAYHFTTETPAPYVDVYNNVITTSALLPAVMSATVSDLDNNISSEVFSSTDPAVTFQNLNVTDPTHPSVEVLASQEGTYTITLTVHDLSGNVATASAGLKVFNDACQAAQAAAGWPGFNNLDRAEPRDCKVDIADLVAMAAQWLNDVSLQAQQSY